MWFCHMWYLTISLKCKLECPEPRNKYIGQIQNGKIIQSSDKT